MLHASFTFAAPALPAQYNTATLIIDGANWLRVS